MKHYANTKGLQMLVVYTVIHTPVDNDSEDCYFLRGGDCWGWASMEE